MSATEKTFESGQQNRPAVFVSWRSLSIGMVLIALLAGAIFIAFAERGSNVERGTRALVEAFSKQRMIEPRLSGGIKCGRFIAAGESSSDVNTEKIELAQKFIVEAVARKDPGAELAYGRLLASKNEKLPDARRYLARAIALSPESPEAHNDLGVCFIQQGMIEDALDEFEAALKIKPEMPEALFNRGLCYQRLLLKAPARTDLAQLETIEPDNEWRKEIRQRLEAVSAPPASQRAPAEKQFDAAIAEGRLDEARQLADQSSEAISRHAVWEISIRQLKAALTGNQPEAAQALSSMDLIGSVLKETRGNSLIADMTRYLRELPDGERRSELDLITAYAETVRRFQSSQAGDELGAFQQLQRQFRERGNHVFEALAAFQSANYCYYKKRFSDSIALLKEVLALVEQHEWPYNRAFALNLLALQTSRLGQDSLAIKYFKQAFALCNKSPQLESQILQYMSVPYWRLGDLDAALDRLRDSTRLYLENGQQAWLFASLAHNYSEIADIYRLRSKHTLSLFYAKEALAYSTQANNLKYAAEYSSFIAIEHARLNQLEEAEVELKNSLAYLNRVEAGRERDFTEALVLINAGEVAARSGDVSRALKYYSDARTLTERGEGTTLATIDVLRGRASAYTASGQAEKAHSDLMEAIGLIEKYWAQIAASDQRSHFLDATHSVFDQLIHLDATVLARPSEAFELSERARARTLLEEIGRDKMPGSRPDPDGSAGDSPGNNRPSQKVSALKLGEVKSYLDDDSMLLEFTVTSKGTFLFLITRSEFKLVQSDATTEILDRLVRDYISDLRRLAPEDELNEKAGVLYDYLIKPVKEELSKKANLWIVPDKALHFLPFAGLVDRSNNSYLIDSQPLTLTYAPSASVLAQCISKERSSRSMSPEKILAVGNPLLNSEYLSNLEPLVEAESEAKRSASVYAPGSVVLVGEQATEPRVRASIADCDVAHLALHCLVEESSPWLAALVLAGAKPTGGPTREPSDAQSGGNTRDLAGGAKTLPPEPTVDANDGLLYLNELYKIRLPHTRLVVLSACESGLGQYYRGEGIVSLVRPLLAAGVPTVVASLWQVNSLATSDLMIAFHNQRKLANRRTGQALHDAQLKVKNSDRFRHPFYWAPFIAVGANN
jgi:CHAT domain-containing protein/lipoprotein NlpI